MIYNSEKYGVTIDLDLLASIQLNPGKKANPNKIAPGIKPHVIFRFKSSEIDNVTSVFDDLSEAKALHSDVAKTFQDYRNKTSST